MDKGVPKRGRDEAEEDPASRLVGRIVEKGFDTENKKKTTTPPPLPSVLPFPVARHRSHGPHWAPISSNVRMDIDDDEELHDDEEDADYDPIASFADPIKRKPKKTLDLSRWRELISQEDPTLLNKQTDKRDKSSIRENQFGGVAVSYIGDERVNRELELSTTGSQLDGTEPEHIDGLVGKSNESKLGNDAINNIESMHIDTKQVDNESQVSGPGSLTNARHNATADDSIHKMNIKQEYALPRDSNLRDFKDEGPVSIESQIDAENRARLQNMSADDIAEAQTEIMEKMKPGLVEMLKKRGRNKLVPKHKIVTSDVENVTKTGTMYTETQIDHVPKGAPSSEESKLQHVSSSKLSSDTHDAEDTSQLKNSDKTSKWDIWSRKVEAVRTLRFSLDGTVLEDLQIPEHENTSGSSQSSADRVTERDFLRTEGDPGRIGYTIKEAVALSRSMVPGQRVIGLQLLATVLDKALCEIQQAQIGWDVDDAGNIDKLVDWKAVWAYALGPDPELALLLRMALDDNHFVVVFAAVKVLHSILCCDINESFFDLSEKMATSGKVISTAPIFRSRPGIEVGFLQGGFWKYNAKSSNILFLGEGTGVSENEGEHTIQDDVVLAGQDFAAGVVRMGIIPRLHYLLETNPSAALEEHLISLLIGLARHSPTCATAIIEFPDLVQTIVDRFTKKDMLEISAAKIKSLTLLKVLAQSDKKTCTNFIEKGIIRDMMWHFYRHPMSFEQWIKSGREYCKLMTSLMIEQLRLWRVCIQYGYCISYFADYFPFLCLWLAPPTFDYLLENNMLVEFASVTRETYLVLEVLARRLPYLHSTEQLNGKSPESEYSRETWSWSQVSPLVEPALKWMSLESNPYISKIIYCHEKPMFVAQESSISCIVWVISAVVHMLSTILKKVTPGSHNSSDGSGNRVPWLPEFVPKIGIEIVKNRFLDFSGADNMVLPRGVSLIKGLCHLRLHDDHDLSLSSVCLLHGIVNLVSSLDRSIQSARQESCIQSPGENNSSREGKILKDGLFHWSREEVRSLFITSMTNLSSSWQEMQYIETFGRGGPAPGVGLGWGASGGGFWSMIVLLKQTESTLLMDLCEMFPVVLDMDKPSAEDITFTMQRVNSILSVCLVAGPRDTFVVEKALDFLLQAPVLKHLDFCVRRFVCNRGIKAFGWVYDEEDYLYIGEILKVHYRNRWLSIKTKSKSINTYSGSDPKLSKKDPSGLGTIYEDPEAFDSTSYPPNSMSMVIEWAHQKLPLPLHWFLSPISTTNDSNTALDGALEVAKSGIFILLSLEAVSSSPCTSVKSSPVQGVPLIWKLHSLSAVLLVGMGVLQEEKSRDMYSALQDLYGQRLDDLGCRNTQTLLDKNNVVMSEAAMEHVVGFLKFQSDIHESYSTFIDMFVDQYGAESYGDVIYGRQVSLYLHRAVEAPVRLAVWAALSNAHILGLLPPLGECFAEAEGYLQTEDHEPILEAYAKSWVSGGLDKAALQGSMTFTLALHHLSSFIFYNDADCSLPMRNKLAKSLLRDLSRKQKHKGIILDLIRYNKPGTSAECEWRENPIVRKREVERRLRLLAESCEGNSTLLTEIEKLKSSPKLLES